MTNSQYRDTMLQSDFAKGRTPAEFLRFLVDAKIEQLVGPEPREASPDEWVYDPDEPDTLE